MPEGAKTAEICPACGARNPLGATRCDSCGKNFADVNAAIRKREKRALTIAVSIVVVAIVLFVLFVPYTHATLEVTVQSTHVDSAVHYSICVNGESRGEGDCSRATPRPGRSSADGRMSPQTR